MTFDVSLIVPARNEFFGEVDLLGETVKNLLANTSDKTQIVVINDGSWPLNPLDSNPRVTVIHHNSSIGQRAACNEGVRVSTAKFICKLDAHCAVGPEFDTKMMVACDYDTTLIPVQYNLHAFSWKCKKCAHETYQGPKPAKCKCGSQFLKQVIKWVPRGWKERDGIWEGRPKTTSWYFDSTLHFQYDGSMAQRFPAEQKLTPTMTCLGACWFLHRERYWELDGMDERHGSWGNQGVELACKTWLSGGQMLINHNTWFAHLFRTQSGPMGTLQNFSFPYANPGGERARARSREVWLENKWPKQIHPLSWLIEKFRPVRDWHTHDNPVLAQVDKAGIAFRVMHPLADDAPPASLAKIAGREQVPANTVGASSLLGARAVASQDVGGRVDQSEMNRVATELVVASEVVQDKIGASTGFTQGSNEPRPHDSMNSNLGTVKSETSIASGGIPDPNPASGNFINANKGKDSGDLSCGEMWNGKILLSSHDATSSVVSGSGSELRDERSSGSIILPLKPRKTLVYYTCNSHDLTLEYAARNNLLKSRNGYELGCVSRERTDFGDWNIVINLPKGVLTMHEQILAGLERAKGEYAFLCENDVMYHPSHFDFTPPSKTKFYYNTNVWRVRYSDGHAVRTDDCKQLSGMCCDRLFLLEHYRKRVERIRKEGFSRKNGFEPGTRGLPWGYDDNPCAAWESPYPNLDITAHGQTLTKPKFSVDEFRNPKYAKGWQETDDPIPGWPKLAGRLQEWLTELANG